MIPTVDSDRYNWNLIRKNRFISKYSIPPLSESELRSYFHRLWTCAGVSVVWNAVLRLTMSCCVAEIVAMKSQSWAKSRQNFDVFGTPNFGVRGYPNFWPNFINLSHHRSMWQSLVTIGQATSEIRRRKKKDLNYSGKKRMAGGHHSCRASGHNKPTR